MSKDLTAHAVVVDCNNEPFAVETARIMEELAAAVREGEIDLARQKTAELDALLLGDRPSTEKRVPLDADALKARAVVQAEILEHHKGQVAAAIQNALQATDQLVLRAYEDGAEVPKATKTHRAKLRALLDDVAAVKTHADLEKISIPEVK